MKFKNIRTGQYSEVNSQDAAIIGISSFKEEPFIAVATQDNVISIYHIGDCKRKRTLDRTGGNYLMVVSPKNTVIACSNGQKSLQTFNYYEKIAGGKKMGWWYPNPYSKEDPPIKGDILDISFNTENQELVVILSNGQIMFCHEKYCRFHSATDIITNFNVSAYDFRGCVCDDRIADQIRQNGGLIDSKIERELSAAQSIMDHNPVLACSPGDLHRSEQSLEQYLSGYSETEREMYRDYYEDELVHGHRNSAYRKRQRGILMDSNICVNQVYTDIRSDKQFRMLWISPQKENSYIYWLNKKSGMPREVPLSQIEEGMQEGWIKECTDPFTLTKEPTPDEAEHRDRLWEKMKEALQDEPGIYDK